MCGMQRRGSVGLGGSMELDLGAQGEWRVWVVGRRKGVGGEEEKKGCKGLGRDVDDLLPA